MHGAHCGGCFSVWRFLRHGTFWTSSQIRLTSIRRYTGLQTTWGYDGANVSGWREDDLILIDKVRLRLWRRRILSAIPKSRSLADVWDEDERGGAKLGINAGGAKAGNDFSCDVDSTHTSHCDFQIAVNQSLNSIALCVHCDIGIGFVELPYAR
jgi:hypothetical protein